MKKENLQAILITIAALLMCFAGCSRNGYGCKGKSRCMTRVAKIEPKYYNGEVLTPDYVHIDTIVVINAKLLNELFSTTYAATDEEISDILGEGCINIADYKDYMKVKK
jgi:hypothetical protein